MVGRSDKNVCDHGCWYVFCTAHDACVCATKVNPTHSHSSPISPRPCTPFVPSLPLHYSPKVRRKRRLRHLRFDPRQGLHRTPWHHTPWHVPWTPVLLVPQRGGCNVWRAVSHNRVCVNVRGSGGRSWGKPYVEGERCEMRGGGGRQRQRQLHWKRKT